MTIESTYRDKLRRRRFAFFESQLRDARRPLRLLDCGGTVEFWEAAGVEEKFNRSLDITIVNIFEPKVKPDYIKWLVGDVRNLSTFRNQEFDIVFSNAVINLMPCWEDQIRMANEVQRLGKKYYIQSPHRYFPIDWRTLVPFFHYLPTKLQAWCFNHFKVGTYQKVRDPKHALVLASRVHDLTVRQFEILFPACNIYKEKLMGFTKSITAYGSPLISSRSN